MGKILEIKMKYKKVVHYSKCKRANGHPGGVEKFAWYLQKAIECDVVVPEDNPVLNDPEILYIVDNHWGLKIGKNCRVICMNHGCAGERGFNTSIGSLQKQMAKRSNTYFVANSLETKQLCEKYYGSRIDELIYLAVDADLYYPPKNRIGDKKIILTSTAGKAHKGSGIIQLVNSLLPKNYVVKDMNCKLNEECDVFKTADMFMLLSEHEGFAYSVLEAMCANLPVLTGPHGIAYELSDTKINGLKVLSDNSLRNVSSIVNSIMGLMYVESVETRQWVLDNCSLDLFNKKWKELIRREQSGC
jgi:hypothetical protein